jgi:FkbM family methyltransferase
MFMPLNPKRPNRPIRYEPIFHIPTDIVRKLCQDADFIDCGVNTGQHVDYFLPHCKRYIAIDCDTRCALELAQKYANNDKVVIVQACLNERTRIASLYLHRKHAVNFSSPSALPNIMPKYYHIYTYTSTLNIILDYFNAKPGIIKVDVEGAEYIVLLGGMRYISAYHPLIMVEIHPSTSLAELFDMLDSLGYEVVRKGASKWSANAHIVLAHNSIIDLFQGQPEPGS